MERVTIWGFDYWKMGCHLTGMSPLLMHSAAGMGTHRGTGRGKNIPPPEVEAERGLYRHENGGLFIPSIALRNCILNGCSRGDFRAGRKSLKALLSAAMLIEPEEIPLLRERAPVTTWAIDTRRAVVQRQGILRSRPLIELPWEADCAVMVDATLYPTAESLAQIGELINFAGKFIGLLDYRPERTGWFGQFQAVLS